MEVEKIFVCESRFRKIGTIWEPDRLVGNRVILIEQSWVDFFNRCERWSGTDKVTYEIVGIGIVNITELEIMKLQAQSITIEGIT